VKVCREIVAPEGGVCDPTFDEDGDCIPDECDDCPNVAQPLIVRSTGTAKAGAACIHPWAPFDRATQRLVFQSFSRANGIWIDDANSFGDEKLRFEKGFARIGRIGGSERKAFLRAGAEARDIVVTATLRFVEGAGIAGIAVRMAPTVPRTAYICGFGNNGTFGLRALACDVNGVCSNVAVVDPMTGAAAQKPIPMTIDFDLPMLVRASAKTNGDTVTLGCQLFPVPTASEVAGSLLSFGSTENTVIVKDYTPAYASGEPGIYTFSTPLEVYSFDVLVSP
jgi:hypothetical protein